MIYDEFMISHTAKFMISQNPKRATYSTAGQAGSRDGRSPPDRQGLGPIRRGDTHQHAHDDAYQHTNQNTLDTHQPPVACENSNKAAGTHSESRRTEVTLQAERIQNVIRT